jgi:hypothetical protein
MNRRTFAALAVALPVALGTAGCAGTPGGSGWTTLFDGTQSLDNWNRTGDANWRIEDRQIVADKGSGYLVTKKSYTNFEIHAEFWASPDCNSGIFMRAQDPQKIGAASSYEVNIFDTRKDQTYATGSIVDIAPVTVPMKAGGKWNTFRIVADGARLEVWMNGVKTVDVVDRKFASGPFALQGAGGTIKWRKVQVREL